MPVSSVKDVPGNAVDEVSRSFRDVDRAVRVVQERQSDGRWTILAELPVGAALAAAAPGMLVVAAHGRDRRA